MIVFDTGFDLWWLAGFLLVSVIIGAGLLEAWRSVDLADDGDGDVRYRGDVQVWSRTAAMEPFGMIRPGVGPLILTVRDGTIAIRHSSFPRRMAATFGNDHTLATAEVLVDPNDEVVSVGRHAVALYTDGHRSRVAFAIRPIDDDLARLRTALALAGARTARVADTPPTRV
jgi:hypothetical protein